MRRLILVCSLLPLLSAAACKDDGDGILTVTYKLGPGDMSACAEFDVVTIKGTLGDAEYEVETPCGDALEFTGVEVGKWNVQVQAIDSEGFVVMDNGASTDRIEVLGGASVDFEAQLTAAPVNVFVRWSIEVGGFPAQCTDGTVDTSQFQVETWDATPGILTSQTFACGAPTDPDSSYRQLKDDDRDIGGATLQEVSVRALDGSGASVGATARFTLDTFPGPGRDVYVTVACTDNVCAATGQPPFDMP